MEAASLFLAPSSLHGGRETAKSCHSRREKPAQQMSSRCGALPVTLSIPSVPMRSGAEPPPQWLTSGAQSSSSPWILALPRGPFAPCAIAAATVPLGATWAESAGGLKNQLLVAARSFSQVWWDQGFPPKKEECQCGGLCLPFPGMNTLSESF